MSVDVKAVQTGMVWVDTKDIPDLEVVKKRYTYPKDEDDSDPFVTYVESGTRIGLPAERAEKLAHAVPNLQIEDRRIAPPVVKKIHVTSLKLRPYQEEAQAEVTQYFDEGGTALNLAGKPSSGKSVLLSSLLAQLQTKTLIIAHLSMLTKQLYEEIAQFTDADVAILTKDTAQLPDVSIATSQLISANPHIWKLIKHNVGLVVVDEAESIGSVTTLRILQRAHARYRIAISATFSRSVDFRTEALYDMIGKKRVELVRSDLIVPTVIGVDCPETFRPPVKKFLYKRAQVKFYTTNTSIDDKVLQIVTSSLSKGRQVLVAVDLIALQERYAEALQASGITCAMINGGVKAEDRTKILADFDAGSISVLLGAQVLNAGLSIPRISTIINVSFPNSDEKLEQLIGRALRDYEGKDGAFIIDLQFQYRAAQKRVRLYKRLQYKFTQTTWSDFKEKL